MSVVHVPERRTWTVVYRLVNSTSVTFSYADGVGLSTVALKAIAGPPAVAVTGTPDRWVLSPSTTTSSTSVSFAAPEAPYEIIVVSFRWSVPPLLSPLCGVPIGSPSRSCTLRDFPAASGNCSGSSPPYTVPSTISSGTDFQVVPSSRYSRLRAFSGRPLPPSTR